MTLDKLPCVRVCARLCSRWRNLGWIVPACVGVRVRVSVYVRVCVARFFAHVYVLLLYFVHG